jgi:hypothetical protein
MAITQANMHRRQIVETPECVSGRSSGDANR